MTTMKDWHMMVCLFSYSIDVLVRNFRNVLVLVLATGSRWPGPLDFPDDTKERDHFVDQWRDKFREAKDVTLVGGGAVGIGKSAR